MGFRTGAYATVWKITPEKDFNTKLQISISKKNKETGEYETEFSGFVSALGTGAAKKAANLTERARIRLGDVDVTNSYNKETKVTYTNYKIFNFATEDDAKFSMSAKDFIVALNDGSKGNAQKVQTASEPEPEVQVTSHELPW